MDESGFLACTAIRQSIKIGASKLAHQNRRIKIG